MHLFLWKMWNWKMLGEPQVDEESEAPEVGYIVPEVNLFRLRLGFWNCFPLIRVRVRFCACFQDALRALPVAAAASSWGFCSCIGRDSVDGSVVVVCGRSINPLHSDCCFEFLFLALFLVSYVFVFCCVFFRREIRSRLCWLLQIVGRRIGSTRVVSEFSGFDLCSF